MEILGFKYEKSDRIEAKGHPISRGLRDKGYTQINNLYGDPQYYVRPCRVWLFVLNNGKEEKWDIYSNIMAIYPNRQKMSLKLAQDVVFQIIAGTISFTIKKGKPFLIKPEMNKN